MSEKLDHASSLVFSIAFLMVLIMVVAAFMYLIVFLLYNVLKLFIDPAVFETYLNVLYFAFLAILFGYMASLFTLNMKRFRNHPTAAKWQFNLSWRLNAVLLPVIYKPVQFIQLTFLSHISKKKFIISYALFLLIFLGTLMGVMLTTVDTNITDTRLFYATNTSARHVELQEYNANLDEDDFLQNATLDQQVQTSEVMPVFIPYPKLLDEQLSQFYRAPNMADSLHAHQPHQLQNRHRIACAERFFSFTADDSV